MIGHPAVAQCYNNDCLAQVCIHVWLIIVTCVCNYIPIWVISLSAENVMDVFGTIRTRITLYYVDVVVCGIFQNTFVIYKHVPLKLKYTEIVEIHTNLNCIWITY